MRAAATPLLVAALFAALFAERAAQGGPAIPPDPSGSTPAPAPPVDRAPAPPAIRAAHLAAVRTEVAPVIDGVLSEPEWRAAPAPPPFAQRRPSPGQAPGDPTELRVLHGDGVLFVGLRMADREPARIRQVLGRRDSAPTSDSVTIYVDPLLGGQQAYFFTVSAAGILADGVVVNQTEMDRSWDAVWWGAAAVDPGGWSAELAIPLVSLPFQDQAAQGWGLYVERYVNRTQEVSSWPAMPPGGNAFVSLFGELGPLRGLERPTTLRIQPYAASRVRLRDPRGRAPTGDSFEPNAGVDLQWSPSPRLRLVLAVNPDFGEVDQDPEVVNLGPEEVFLDERRPFFTAGLDLFRTPTPPAQGRFLFLNTRRMGAAVPPVAPADGETVLEADGQRRVLGALKLLGEADRQTSYGLVSVLEESAHAAVARFNPVTEGTTVVDRELAPTTHVGVARGRRRLSERSYVGLLATSVNRLGEEEVRVQPSGELTADTDAYAGAIDWMLRDPSGRQLAGFVSASRSRQGSGAAGYLQAGQLGFHEWIYKAELEVYSSEYDINDAGFLRRADHMEGVVRVDRQLVRPWGPLARGNVALTTIHQLGFADPGQVQRRFFRLSGGATTLDSWQAGLELGLELPRADVLETRGGPVFPRPWALRLVGDLQSSASRSVWATWHNQADREGDATRWLSQLTGSALFVDRWTTSLLAGWRANRRDPFFVDAIRDQGLPRHVVGDLDFDELELRTTSTLGIHRALTLQLYAQLLRAVGHYRRFRELVEGPDGEVDLAPSSFGGGIDFVRLSVATNAVVRWDLGGGAAALIAYRAESLLASSGDAAPFSVREGLDQLRGEGLAQTLYVKISHAWDAL